MDPNNPVVKLCVEGMRAEGDGRYADAAALFAQAWERAADDFEKCIAAHYVARHQDPAGMLRWNRLALAYADAVGDQRVEGFYPSLHLNLGYSYEQLGNVAEARRWYALAGAGAEQLPADRYGGVVRGGAANGLARVGEAEADRKPHARLP